LAAAGRMQPRGLEVVALARKNGSWDSLNDVDAMIEPQDLRDALDSVADARRYWDAYPASYRRGILYRLQSAKRAHTRAERIEQTVSHAARNTRLGGITRAPLNRENRAGKNV
ncbi:MAG: YdeI/OmpD-associated family protein, partial [Dehalococcoidia bacterium]|nr:YdeI/OmpD-associated family protein [Dehalococcoidia bacterium]